MTVQALWIFPVLTFVFGVLSFFIGYGIAVGNGVEKAWFSYISDGGAKPPESCIFGQLLNLSALFLMVSVYLRHRQYVVFYCHQLGRRHECWRPWSLALMFLGFAAAFGMSMVANFQETAVPICHLIGAMLAFFGACLYIWGQIVLSYLLVPHMTPLWMNHLRSLLTLFGTALLILHMVCEYAEPFVKRDKNGVLPTKPPNADGEIVKFDPSSPFYTNHLVTTCAEWGLALAFEVVLLTFAWELRRFYAHMPKVRSKTGGVQRVAPSLDDDDNNITYKANGISTVVVHDSTDYCDDDRLPLGHLPRARTIEYSPRHRPMPAETLRNEYLY